MSGLFGGKTINNTEQQLGSLRINSSSQGVPIALAYGLVRLSPNLIWYDDFTAIPHTDSQTAGKGGGTTVNNTTFTYTAAMILALGEGPITTVGRVWKNKDITTTGNLGLTVFDGNYPQAPWSFMTTSHANEALGYIGTAYVASAALDLGTSNSTPNLSFEVGARLYCGCPDVNLADIFEDFLTAEHYGAGFPAAMLGNLSQFETYSEASGFRAAPAYTAQKSAADCITELADIGNSGIVWSEGLLKVIPYAEESVTGNSSVCGQVDSNLVTVALFNFDNANDATSFHHDLTTFGGGAGISGGTLVLDGTAGGYVLGGPYATFDLTTRFTLQGRVTLPASQGSSFPTIFTLFSNDHSDYIMLRFDRESHLGRFELFLGYSGGITAYSTDTFVPGEYHWAIQCTACGTALWIEGQRQTSFINTGGGNSPANLELMLGSQPTGTSGNTPSSGSTFAGVLTSWKATQGVVFTTDSFTPPSEPLQLDSSSTTYICGTGNAVTFTPDITARYDLTYDDFLASPGEDPIKVRRKRQADAYNQVQIECLDREDNFNSAVVSDQDDWNVDLYGLRPAPVINCHAITNPAVARAMAAIKLQRTLYQRNEYEFYLGWRYIRLEPMDVVTLTDAKLGLSRFPVRLKSVEESEDGKLRVVAEELLQGVSSAAAPTSNYSSLVQTAAGYTPNAAADPGDTHTPVIFMPPATASGGVNQVWIGAAGGANWGGALVYVSTDGSTYQQEGTLTAPARYGTLTANLPAGSDPDTTSTLSVDLSTSNGSLDGATAAAADAQSTLAYVGPQAACELVAYSAANLTSAHHYDLDTYLRRGQLGSTSQAHTSGSPFLRLDSAVAKFNVPDSLLGTTIYVKLPAYNLQGGGTQDLSQVEAYAFNIPVPAANSGTQAPSSSTAAALLTLEKGLLKAQRVGASYVGLRADGALQFNPQLLYKLSATTGALQATSFNVSATNGYWTDLVADGAGSLFVSAYEAPSGFYSASNIYRLDATGNMAAAAATYTHNTPASNGLVSALAYDGSKLWSAEIFTGKLVRLTASNLAAEANYSLVGLANATSAAMTYDGGSLYVAVNDTTPELVRWVTANQTVAWNVSIPNAGAAVVVSGNLVFVSTESGVSVRNTANGAQVNLIDARGGEAYLFGSGAYVLVNDYPAVNSGGKSQLLLIDAATGNLSRALDIPLSFLSGTDGDLILVADSPTSDYRDYRTYLYRLFLTGVSLNLPSTLFNTSSSSVSGNLSANLATQNAGTFFAGPTSGNAAQPTFRSIVPSDVPVFVGSGANHAAGLVPDPGSTAGNTRVLREDGVWANIAGNVGTVTSVGLNLPSVLFTVSNSPVTGNGTLTANLNTQNASTFFAGPSSGNAAAPAFRVLVGGDMPRLTVNTQTANYTLVLADANIAYLRMNSANATVITVPTNANVAFANGSSIVINRAGNGAVTVVAQNASTTTVHNSSSNALRAQGSGAALVKVSTDEWDLFGDLT